MDNKIKIVMDQFAAGAVTLKTAFTGKSEAGGGNCGGKVVYSLWTESVSAKLWKNHIKLLTSKLDAASCANIPAV